MAPEPPGVTPAAQLLAVLGRRGLTLAVAESLTGGLASDALVQVPGASAVLRGGIVAYATDLKHTLLGVDGALLAEHGAIHPEVARQMAEGVRAACGARVGIATTGVAGPDPQDGHPPGEVYVAVAGPAGSAVLPLQLAGDRPAIRAAAVDAALRFALEHLAEDEPE
ncbi:CinA family protein [Naasia aerilata]|uniref:Competence protein n=1 Tax=Naasia aerilata TaxID=1162966 RepID=A0ABM8GGX4_9MICO|nr:CinA family protein [Naasia aerilata]BDZ47591.1 competence protein [Naasia aerilata]